MQHIVNRVNDARCPCGQAACEAKREAVARRRMAIIEAQELMFAETCRNLHQHGEALPAEELRDAA